MNGLGSRSSSELAFIADKHETQTAAVLLMDRGWQGARGTLIFLCRWKGMHARGEKEMERKRERKREIICWFSAAGCLALLHRPFWKSVAGYQVVFSYRSTFRRESSTTCPLLTPLRAFPRSSDSLSCYNVEQVDSDCLMEGFENEVSAGMEQAAMAVRLCSQSARKIKLKFEHRTGQTQTTTIVVSGLHVIIF